MADRTGRAGHPSGFVDLAQVKRTFRKWIGNSASGNRYTRTWFAPGAAGTNFAAFDPGQTRPVDQDLSYPGPQLAISHVTAPCATVTPARRSLEDKDLIPSKSSIFQMVSFQYAGIFHA